MSAERAGALWCELAWLGGERAEAGVLIELDGERIAEVDVGVDRAAAARDDACRPDDPGNGQRALARFPASPARAHPGRAGRLLDVAAAHVRDRGGDRTRHLLRPGPRDLRRNGAGRDHGRRRVPLPPSRARGQPLRRPERDGEGGDRSGRARPESASPCSTPATSTAGSDRRRRASSCASPTAPPTPGRSGSTGSRRRRRPESARRSTASARSTRRPRPGWRRFAAERSWPLHAHVSEQPAENEDCRCRLRDDPDRAARRGRRPLRALHRSPRHASGRRRLRTARRGRMRSVSLPDDGARPRRRRRAGAPPGRSRRAPLPGHRLATP